MSGAQRLDGLLVSFVWRNDSENETQVGSFTDLRQQRLVL